MDSVTGKANSTNTAQLDVLKLIKPLCLAQDDAAKMRRNGEFASRTLHCAGYDSFFRLVKMRDSP